MSKNGTYNRYSGHGASSGRSRKKRHGGGVGAAKIAAAVAIVIAVIVVGVLVMKGCGIGSGTDSEESQSEETSPEATEDVIENNIAVDVSAIYDAGSGIADDNLIYVKGMTDAEISKAISDCYEWSLAITNSDAEVGSTVKPRVDINQTTEAATMGDAEHPDQGSDTTEETVSEITVTDRISVDDLIAERIPAFIESVRAEDERLSAEKAEGTPDASVTSEAEETSALEDSGSEGADGTSEDDTSGQAPDSVLTFTLDDLSSEVESIANYAGEMWYVEALGGSIGSYDSSSGSFVMEGARNGFEVDKDKLASDLMSAISDREFGEEVAVTGNVLSAETATSSLGDYKIIGSYTTNTTSNSVRNKNISLACQKLNGTIVRPGEEFSFNDTVGQRTEEKGYGAAAAYNNGEVVQEVGGGVCQVSTTLYNAVLKAGLKITARQSHTFKPTYVTPGQDATVSWGGPDFRFANLPNKPEYSNDSTYAIGILASYSNQTVTVQIYGRPVLKSGYTFSLDSQKIKDIDLVRVKIEPGSDKTPTTGTMGSQWETRLIIKKDGETVSSNVDHNAYYSGHIEYYTDETSSEETSESPSDGISDAPLELESESTTAGGFGPGFETTAAGNSPGGASSPSETTQASPKPEVQPTESASATVEAPSPETTAAASPSPDSSSPSGDGGQVISGGPGSVSSSSTGPGA